MKLDIDSWKEFQINKLFKVEYGNSLELESCEETTKDDPEKINFVARTRENNGVTAYVKRIPNVEPSKAGIITVAGSGSSTLSTFVQEGDFYSGYHLFLLIPKDGYSKEIKQFICICLELDKYKYWYGRQANKTLPFIKIKLPVKYNTDGSPVKDDSCRFSDEGYIPDWQFMEDYIKSLHHKPLTTKNRTGQVPELKVTEWKEFLLSDYFDIVPGKYHYPDEYEDGATPYYSASNENNGIGSYIDLLPDFEGNCIVTGKIGCTAFYAPDPFCATSDVNIFKPKFDMTCNMGLFISRVINFNENYKWAYGRQCRVGNSKRIVVKLPIDADGNPDWQFMENYIKVLPYGDRLVDTV